MPTAGLLVIVVFACSSFGCKSPPRHDILCHHGLGYDEPCGRALRQGPPHHSKAKWKDDGYFLFLLQECQASPVALHDSHHDKIQLWYRSWYAKHCKDLTHVTWNGVARSLVTESLREDVFGCSNPWKATWVGFYFIF